MAGGEIGNEIVLHHLWRQLVDVEPAVRRRCWCRHGATMRPRLESDDILRGRIGVDVQQTLRRGNQRNARFPTPAGRRCVWERVRECVRVFVKAWAFARRRSEYARRVICLSLSLSLSLSLTHERTF